MKKFKLIKKNLKKYTLKKWKNYNTVMKKLFYILFFILPIFGYSQTFVKEYTYNASDNDSKIDARNNALKEVKRLLIEELGVYINTTTTLHNKNGKNNIDIETQTKVISECITETKILDEKWNGEQYYIKVKMYIDKKDLIKRLEKLSTTQEIIIYRDIVKPKEKEKWIDINNEYLYGALNINYHYYQSVGIGLMFGIDIDNKFIIGLYGDMNVDGNGYSGNNKGLFFEPLFLPTKKVSLSLPIKLGNCIIVDDPLIDNYFYCEPSFNINILISDSFRISTGVGYRISDYQSMPTINIAFKIIN